MYQQWNIFKIKLFVSVTVDSTAYFLHWMKVFSVSSFMTVVYTWSVPSANHCSLVVFLYDVAIQLLEALPQNEALKEMVALLHIYKQLNGGQWITATLGFSGCVCPDAQKKFLAFGRWNKFKVFSLLNILRCGKCMSLVLIWIYGPQKFCSYTFN